MLKNTIVALLVAVTSSSGHLSAADHVLARFDGAVGVDPVSSLASPILVNTPTGQTFENATRNFVRGVPSSLAIWRIADFQAEVDSDGRIRATGRGLVLGGGDRIGQSLGLKVFATLVCEEQAPFVELNSTDLTTDTFDGAATLDANGDFRIEGNLRSALGDLPPTVCAEPVLLIRAASNRAWLAAGLLRHDQ